MLRTVRAILKNDSTDLFSELGIGGGLALLTALVVVIALTLADGPRDGAQFPAIVWGVFAGIGCILILVIGVLRMTAMFPMLLLFPITRRAAVAGECASIVLHALAVEAVLAVFGPLVFLLCGQVSALPGLLAQVPWWGWLVWLLPPLAAVLLALFCGGTIARFGRRGGWFLYFFFLIPCWFASPMIDWFEQLALAPAQLQALLAAAAAAVVVLPVLGLRWLLRAAVQ